MASEEDDKKAAINVVHFTAQFENSVRQ